MCLGIPGKIIEISDASRKLATVDISGVKREVNIACIVGDEPVENLIGTWPAQIGRASCRERV